MQSLLLASRTICQGLQSGQIGNPVSVRLINQDCSQPLETSISDSLDHVCLWMDHLPNAIIAMRYPQTNSLSIHLQFPDGQMALLSIGTTPGNQNTFEVIVMGNQGLLTWEPDTVSQPPCNDKTDNIKPIGKTLLPAIEQSLVSGRVVHLDNSGQWTTSQQKTSPLAVTHTAPASDQPRRPVTVRQTKKPYGVLLVAGAHTHQENYAVALAEDSRCQLIGLTDEPGITERRARLNQQLADKLHIPLIPDIDRALASTDVHIVSICTEPERRSRTAVRCAQAGKHLYLDKPMAISHVEAEQIVAAAEQNGVISHMFSQIHTDFASQVKSVLDSSLIGDLREIHCDLLFAKGHTGTALLGKPRLESVDPKEFEIIDSKRELFNIGIYPLALVRWLTGLDVVRVYARTANFFFHEYQKNDMEDYAEVMLGLTGGLVVTLAVGRTGWKSHPMGAFNRTTLVGTLATACIDASRPRLATWSSQTDWHPPERNPEDPMGFWSSTQEAVDIQPRNAWIASRSTACGDARHFIDCVEAGKPSDVSAREAAHSVHTLLAAYESAATGEVVEVNHTES